MKGKIMKRNNHYIVYEMQYSQQYKRHIEIILDYFPDFQTANVFAKKTHGIVRKLNRAVL